MGTKRDSIIYNFKNLSPEIKQQYYSDIENKLKQMHGKIMAEVQVIEKHAQAIVAELLQEARTPTEIDNV